jgi:cobalt-zinc-cadmium resistance protein CzcA
MLQSIISFSIKQKLITGLMVLGLVVIGIWQVTLLPIDAVPDITNNQVQINARAPALSAFEIEKQVTFPIENLLRKKGTCKQTR